MGFKSVCTNCRSSFSEGNDPEKITKRTCTTCHEPLFITHHKFKPPKKSEIKKWKVVKYLLDNGFEFGAHWVPLDGPGGSSPVSFNTGPYPETMKEAEEFVKTFKVK